MRTTSPKSEGTIDRVAEEIVSGATRFAARARSERAALLTLTETAVLGQLFKHEAMTPTEVGRRLGMKKQALTRTFAKLERQALVQRLDDPADGRQSILSITAAGAKALGEEMRPRREWAAGAIEGRLSAAEVETLRDAAALLARLSEVDTELVSDR